MKIAKILKPYFNVSMTRVDDKRIKVFQVSNDEIKLKIKVAKKTIKITSKTFKEPVIIAKSINALEKKIADINF
jgi:ribosomal protein L7/L12